MLKLVVIAILVSCALGDAVLELTDSNFEGTISDHDTILIMFYAPWCGHCKKIKPEFEQAAGILQSSDPPVALAKVDCTEAGKDTCSKFEVRGYPTIKIFKGGELSQEYNGPREASGIVKYMKAQVGPASKELTADNFKAFIGKTDVAIVGFVKDGSAMATTFAKVADKLREKYQFGHTSDAALLAEHGEDVVVLFRPSHLKNTFEPSSVTTDDTERVIVEAFIKKNYHGLVGHRTTDNAADFKAPLIVAYYNVDYLKNVKGTNYWRNRVMKVAKAVGEDITFAVSQHNDFQHELEEYGRGYVAGDKPVICARDADNRKFVMEGEFSMDELEKFIEAFKAGELSPFLKSEKVPEPNDGLVTVAVAKNFDDVVINNDKDTLIEFYAPWCGHCKKLTPIFDELGEKMKDEPEIAIVKMDATANDVPSAFDVKGFPTLYFAPKNSKSSPKKYEAGRELDDFTKYLAEHATNELRGWDRAGLAKKTEL